MARAQTAKFHQFVLHIETDTPGTYARICGLTSRGIQRQNNMETSEVPDCDDESLPSSVERSVRSQEVTISGSGVWAAQSHEMILDWWYSGLPKNIRIEHVRAGVGDTQYEAGSAYLVSVSNQAEDKQQVTAEISIEFDGLPTRTAKAA